MLTDIHTHTTFSPDGKDDMETMINEAERLGISYYGIAEHFDYDYLVNNISFEDVPAIYTDAEAYFQTGRAMQKNAKLHLLLGGEFGYTDNQKVVPLYQEIIETYHPDFIVNSIHTNGEYDYYFMNLHPTRPQRVVYEEYLSLVRKSLDAPYPYDVVAHLCYASRYTSYQEPLFRYEDYPDEFDDILSTIIQKGKILEVNSSAKGSGSEFLPPRDILERYYELGGRQISIASDAHDKSRIMEKRELIVSVLKGIGFTYVTVPCKGKYLKIDL